MAFILSEVVGVISVFQIQQTALRESLEDKNQICTWISGLNDCPCECLEAFGGFTGKVCTHF